MKKFIDGKKPPPQATTKPGFPGSVLYVGSLKARLSKTDTDISKDIKDISKNPAMSTTVFLGKMISRKDKQGLIRGGSNNSDEEVESYKDNPVFLALEKVKMRQQTSLDSDSRAASRTSHIRQQLEIYCTYILVVMALLAILGIDIKNVHKFLISLPSVKSNNNLDLMVGDEGKDPGMLLEESVGSLNAGLLKVKTGNIREWNIHKHVKGDRELKPILIPF